MQIIIFILVKANALTCVKVLNKQYNQSCCTHNQLCCKNNNWCFKVCKHPWL